jgi:hypothetical protein
MRNPADVEAFAEPHPDVHLQPPSFTLFSRCRLRIFELFPVLLGILLSWFIAWLLTIGGVYNAAAPAVQAACRTDQSNVLFNSPWFRFPYPGQWGPIHISWASTLTMLAGGVGWCMPVGCACGALGLAVLHYNTVRCMFGAENQPKDKPASLLMGF